MEPVAEAIACARLRTGHLPGQNVTPKMRPVSRRAFILRQLVRRDLQARYSGSALGLLWSFVHPLWQLVLFTWVFSYVMRVPITGQGTSRFAVFLFAGLLPWLAVQEALARSTVAVTDNAGLVKRSNFPSELLVLALVASTLVHESIAGFVYAGVLVWFGEGAWSHLLWLAPAVLLQVALTTGLGLALAALHVLLRDVAQLVPVVLSAWFYLTPIVYPTTLIPEGPRNLLAFNPLAALVGLYRTAFLGAPAPSPVALLVLTGCGLGALTLGWILFRRLRPRFADEI